MYIYMYIYFEMQYIPTNMTKLQFMYIYIYIYINYIYIYIYPYNNYISTSKLNHNFSQFFVDCDEAIVCETTFDNIYTYKLRHTRRCS